MIFVGATTSIDDVRRTFPRTEVLEPPRVAMPHAFHRLIPGSFGKRMSEGRRRKLGVWHKVWNADRQQGAVIHKCATDALHGVPDIKVVTHGANAGDDALRDVETLSVIGGISIPAREVAALAAARTGRAVTPADAIATTVPVLMSDGSGALVRVRAYADADAQAVHRAAYHGSIMQGAMRARQVLRTEANPAEVNTFGYAAPDLPIDGRRAAHDRHARFLISGEVIFASVRESPP